MDSALVILDTTCPLQTMYPDCHVELTWEPLHLAGIADAHLYKEEFEWLSRDVEVCQDLYNKFNCGKSYEKLIDTSAELEVKFVRWNKSCQMRFANSKRLVFINIMKSLCVIMPCLQKHQLWNESSYKQKWANEAANLEGLLFNGMCLLHIAGEGGLYNVYVHLINVVQKVQLHILKETSFDKEVEELKQNTLHTDHSQCPEECYWPQYHSAVTIYLGDSSIMGVPVTHSKPYRGALGVNMTHLQSKHELTATNEATSADCNDKPSKLVTASAGGFPWRRVTCHQDHRCGDQHGEIVLQCERGWCCQDSYNHRKGVPRAIRQLNIYVRWHGWWRAVKWVQKTTEQFVIWTSYKVGLCLERWQSWCSCFSWCLQALLNSNTELYLGCEMRCHAVVASALEKSFESVVQSMVNTHEHKFYKSRNVPDSAAVMEMEISVNGPSLLICHAVIWKAIT